jgi:hypothetical protein
MFLETATAKSGSYTGDFSYRARILTVIGAKYMATRLYPALISVQGLPSDKDKAAAKSPLPAKHRAEFSVLGEAPASQRVNFLKLSLHEKSVWYCRTKLRIGYTARSSPPRLGGVLTAQGIGGVRSPVTPHRRDKMLRIVGAPAGLPYGVLSIVGKGQLIKRQKQIHKKTAALDTFLRIIYIVYRPTVGL